MSKMINNDDDESMRVIDERNMASLLIFVRDHNEVIADDLRQIGGSYQRLKELAFKLEEKGLLEVTIQKSPFRRFTFKITPKGREVAEKLEDIEQMIQKD